VLVLFLSLFCLFSLSYAEDEKITITTFYPSPYGVYKELATDGLKVGETYSGVGNTPPTSGLIVEGNVGIGTSDPQAKLVVMDGNVGIGTENPGTYDSKEVSLDVDGYSAAKDVWLKDANKWASQARANFTQIYCKKANSGALLDPNAQYLNDGDNPIRQRPETASCPSGYKLINHALDYAYAAHTDWNDNQQTAYFVLGDYTNNSITCYNSSYVWSITGGMGLCVQD